MFIKNPEKAVQKVLGRNVREFAIAPRNVYLYDGGACINTLGEIIERTFPIRIIRTAPIEFLQRGINLRNSWMLENQLVGSDICLFLSEYLCPHINVARTSRSKVIVFGGRHSKFRAKIVRPKSHESWQKKIYGGTIRGNSSEIQNWAEHYLFSRDEYIAAVANDLLKRHKIWSD